MRQPTLFLSRSGTSDTWRTAHLFLHSSSSFPASPPSPFLRSTSFTFLASFISITPSRGLTSSPPANIGPRSGPGAGKKPGYGTGKQTLRLKSNGTGKVEEVSGPWVPGDGVLILVQVDSVRTTAEENINALLENFMGINDAELGETNSFNVI